MDYTGKHDQALKKVQSKGAPVTFTTEDEGTYDPKTDRFVDPTTPQVSGHAVELPGDPEEYEALELIRMSPVTLFFVPTVFGQSPALDSTVNWAGAVRTVRNIRPVRPAGTLIAARVIVT